MCHAIHRPGIVLREDKASYGSEHETRGAEYAAGHPEPYKHWQQEVERDQQGDVEFILPDQLKIYNSSFSSDTVAT